VLLKRSWIYETTYVAVTLDSLLVFLQLPINIIFPMSVVYGMMGGACLYPCIHACMYDCMYNYLCVCMHYACMYVCM